ncbi:MAG: hypothetical protein AABM40_05775 [Chloroflexota bacterium]
MDALSAAIVGGVIGAVVGGAFSWFVALRTAAFSRKIAFEMWQHADANAGADLLRALVSELDENVAALGDGTVDARPVGRSAWERARHLGVSDSNHALMRDAYVAAGEVNRRIALLDAESVNPPIGDRTDAGIRRMNLNDNVKKAAAAARSGMVEARTALLAEIERLQEDA